MRISTFKREKYDFDICGSVYKDHLTMNYYPAMDIDAVCHEPFEKSVVNIIDGSKM